MSNRNARVLLLADDRDLSVALAGACFQPLSPADTPRDLTRLCEIAAPSLALLDLGKPVALERFDWLHAAAIDPPVVVIADAFDRTLLAKTVRARVRGYLVRPFADAQLVATIVLALSAASPSRLIAPLSPRERQVLTALLEYRRPPTIAQELGLSPNTVRNHLKSIFFKLGVSSQQELLDHVRAAGEGLPRPRATALRA